jgi:hypothetical protein
MARTADEPTLVFIVRIWCTASTLPDVRGTVEHVRTGERQKLHRLADIVSFVRRYVRAVLPRRTASATVVRRLPRRPKSP